MPSFDPTYSGNQVLGLGAQPTEIPDPTLDTSASDGVGITINEDGSVEIGPPESPELDPASGKFDENLADKLDSGTLSSVAEDIIEGVQADLMSRSGFIENYNKGLELLGLKIEESTTTRTQKRNVSRVGHPLLLEAVVRFQAQARAEILPAFGPCKVAEIGGSTEEQDQLASDLESDMNYFLTQVDKGYYSDFDRGLFALGFGGNLIKKAYHDPIKRLPLSRSIQIEDFIVSENASDLYDAQRKTHRIFMTAGEIKKMQFAKAYRDIEIGDGQFSNDPTKQKQGDIIGVAFSQNRQQDQEHEIYETYTDIDPARLGYKEKGAPEGLPLPYIMTIDCSSRGVLALRRNWKKGDPQFCERRRFVHYGLIPSFGFLCLGYLHLLGNQTRALRAIWRILIDAGMFANFPGGMKAKSVRTDTNEISPGPGEFVDIDIGPFDNIKDAFMMMPYKDISPTFIQLSEIIGQDSQRMGGLPEMEVGEGRTHIPVGTMMSMIEQATQTMVSVHKRMHSAMQEELSLLKELFSEDPDALARLARDPARKWTVGAEFDNLNLVPASDPNIPSQTHRVQQATALVSLSQSQVGMQLYDQMAVQKRVLKAIGMNDWQTLVHPASPQQHQPDPKTVAAQLDAQGKAAQLQADQQENQRKAAHELAQSADEQQARKQEAQLELFQLHTQKEIASEKAETERLRFAHDFASAHQDRQHEHNLTGLAEAAKTHRDMYKADTQAETVRHTAALAAANKPEPAAPKTKTKAKKSKKAKD